MTESSFAGEHRCRGGLPSTLRTRSARRLVPARNDAHVLRRTCQLSRRRDAFSARPATAMTLHTVRSAARRAAALPKQSTLRAASTKAPSLSGASSSRPPRLSLPAEKLRQLVSLYHQSKEFVTRDNLDRKIDQAFIDTPAITSRSTDPQKTYPDLMHDIIRRRQQPAVRPLSPVTSTQSVRANVARSEAVFEALYGSSHGRSPGLELVLESWGSTSKRLEELKEEKAANAPVQRGRSRPARKYCTALFSFSIRSCNHLGS